MSALSNLFETSNIRNKNGEIVDLAKHCAGKSVGIYFSAHWCGPCRYFTPELVKFYNQYSEKKKFEIVFVSSDHDQKAFNEYYAEMPWLGLDFGNREKKADLSAKYQVSGIPTLVIIDGDSGSLLHDDATVFIGENEKDPSFPWNISQ